MPDFDLFYFFRTALFIFITIYAVLSAISGLKRLHEIFYGDDPRKEMLRVYVTYQLLTIQAVGLRGELARIGLLLALLLLIWRLHAYV